jgi:hypothetical protein
MAISVSVHITAASTIRVAGLGRARWVVVDDGASTTDLFPSGDEADVIGVCDRLQVALGEIRDAAVRRLAERATVRLSGFDAASGRDSTWLWRTEDGITTTVQIEPPITESEARALAGDR